MESLYDLKISKKMTLFILAASLLAFYSGVKIMDSLITDSDMFSFLSGEEAAEASYVNEAKLSLINYGHAQNGFLRASSLEERKKYFNAMRKFETIFLENMEKIRSRWYSGNDKQAALKLNKTWNDYSRLSGQIKALAVKENIPSAEGKINAGQELYVRSALIYDETLLEMSVFLLAAIGAGVAFGLLVSRMIRRPLIKI